MVDARSAERHERAASGSPPPEALHDEELGGFAVCGRDAEGQRDGACRVYRANGTLLLEGSFSAGQRAGMFTSYHPNGAVKSAGEYVNGKLEGTFVRYASQLAGSEPLRSCCVPKGAQELRMFYRRGRCVGERFHDALGRGLRSNGELLPERPAALPPDADFDEGSERWVLRAETPDGAELRRGFDLSGRLLEETEWADGHRRVCRLFDENAILREERQLDSKGRAHGSYWKRQPAGHFRDPKLVSERGTHEHGLLVGSWSYSSAEGEELARRERGSALSEAELGTLIADDLADATATELRERSERCFQERSVREALWFAARAAARSRERAVFSESYERSVVPLAREPAVALARILARSTKTTLSGCFEALLSGAEPAEVLRVMATLMPEGTFAARDLVEASLLLEPGAESAHATRAMIRIENGDAAGAQEDTAALSEGEAKTLLTHTERMLFSGFRFDVTEADVLAPNPELPEVEVAQPVEAVQHAIRLYATRLSRVRSKIRERLGGAEPAWLPPDVAELGGADPVELRRFRATIQDEGEVGMESSEVDVDEAAGLDARSVRGLLEAARADFDALSWLCWSVGSMRIELPERIEMPATFPAAVNECMARCFRAHDQVRTSGLTARARGVPGFLWQGLDVATLPRSLARILARQYMERRAMFFWLLFAENVSPFQSDLRKV